MATTSASSAQTPSYNYADHYATRLARSLARYNAKLNNPSSILARKFFEDTSSSSSPLSSRLIQLAQHVQDHDDDDVTNNQQQCTAESLAAAIFARAPSTFIKECQSLFEELMEYHQKEWEQSQEDTADYSGINYDDYHLPTTKSHQEETYKALSKLNWITDHHLLHPFLSSLTSITKRSIRHILDNNDSEYNNNNSQLSKVLSWKDSVLTPFVRRIISNPTKYTNDRWDDKLSYLTHESFIQLRSSAFFELITDYPDSIPSISELTTALHNIKRREVYADIASQWRIILEKRLIHPGATTSQIIDVYINAIRVLREMGDGSGELLYVVTKSVRDYLRSREDTVRCIVMGLTEEEGEGGDFLYEELRRGDAKPLLEEELEEDDDEEEGNYEENSMPSFFDWTPPPSILKRRGVISGRVGKVGSRSRRAGDILSMLVGIYGSKELFVNEYRIMLADKLLSNLEYDTDKEVHNLELLKLRFGEASMRQCEVMIKDIDDSKRIHHNICSTLNNDSMKDDDNGDPPVVDASIVSHIFWPSLQKEEMKNHHRIQSQLDRFGDEYAKLKNPRRLVWMKQLGHVELEVEVYEPDEDGQMVSHTKEVKCTPAHATLLAHFEDKTFWTVEDLAIETEMPDELVRKRMGFWINQRVVDEYQGGYTLVSAHEANASEQCFVDHEDDHHEHAVSFGADQEEAMQVYESYIVGMLSNLGQIPLEKIHTMLKTFVAGSDHKYDKTPQQLAVFLQQLCKEEKLECSPDGLYKLLKKRS